MPWNLNKVFNYRMACAAIPGPSTSSEQPELPNVQPTVFAPVKKYVKPLKGPPITNVSRFMACHLELNYAEVSKLISYCFLPVVNVHVY